MLAIKIRNAVNIRGLVFNNHEVVTTQYADDLSIFLRDEESMVNALDILSEFRNGTRPRIGHNLTGFT